MTTTYSVYGCRLTVEAWPALAAAIHDRLERFTAETLTSSHLTISFSEHDPRDSPAVHASGRRVYDMPNGGYVAFDDGRDLLTLAVGDRVRGCCQAADGQARVVVDAPRDADTWVLSHPVFSLLLMELLKRRGYFPVHAAGLAHDEDGVLFAGTSGAGKSTLAVALARSGFAFLSDDTLFLEADASQWRARSFPDQVDLCADAPLLFPELHAQAERGRVTGWPKFQLRAEHVYGSAIPDGVVPRVLIFPSVHRGAESRLKRIAPEVALLALAPNVLLTDAATSQRHFDALAGLVTQCTSYRLETGYAIDQAVDVVRLAMAATGSRAH